MNTLLRIIIGLFLRSYHNIEVIGRENIPADGVFAVTANHQAAVDSWGLPVVLRRNLIFVSKQEYFNKRGVVGWLLRWVLSHGAIPLDRKSVTSGVRVMNRLVEELKNGNCVGLHPEATRVPPHIVCKGKSGIIDVAWRTGAPILPVGIIGSYDANRPGRHLPRFQSKITFVIGEPMTFSRPPVLGGVKVARAHIQEAQMRTLMQEIARLAQMPYVDEDAADVKKHMEDDE